ncbi:MAG: molybdenum cofactor guanylyltransferase [Desulfotomaculaceae bacterium]|nr:molybdenum cofactor guanylyltransferase [Desulfotomaculaceae bacterium]
MINATGVILAGGKSSRMGANKALINIGKKGMIERVASELEKVCAEVLVSGGDEKNGKQLGLKVVPDMIPGRGPLSGIHASLHVAEYDICLVAACDMPFIRAELASLMLQEVKGYDAAVPRHGIYLQPLFAVYCKSCLPALEGYLNSGGIAVAKSLPLLRVNYVSEEKVGLLTDVETVFFNVNTPEDLTKARKMDRKTKENSQI